MLIQQDKIENKNHLCDTCFHKDVCTDREFMDEDDERALTFCSNYHDEDNVIDWTSSDNFWSMRQARADMLNREFGHWSSIGAFDDFINTLGHELSWRMITRIVHKLERKRGAKNG